MIYVNQVASLQSEVPTCFKKIPVILVQKKTYATCLNDYFPVTLTSRSMKCFERRLRKLGMSVRPLTNLYWCTIESILSGYIM
eukprot:g22953.t1